eukprot:TRINITY_DN56189_c0_g1_i1.p2 TRINITY_DN56189_c0_g1~~TRINITY_DN56189_c0_g1_i1.p2  ORF type:complete len:297 (+),score=68.23 TRINITY_DN56189_c0_g1_i1:37-891(+)
MSGLPALIRRRTAVAAAKKLPVDGASEALRLARQSGSDRCGRGRLSLTRRSISSCSSDHWRGCAFGIGGSSAAASRGYSCSSSPSFSSSAEARLSATRRWLDDVVIGERLCPFAPPVRAAPRLRLRASEAQDADGVVAEVAREAADLVKGLRAGAGGELPETTLLVLDAAWDFVADWQALVRLSWRLQAEAIHEPGFGEEVQIVLFHPEATHSAYAEGPEDAADYTIRAPHPTVHLLREVDLLAGVEAYPGADQIPARNKARLRSQGLEACEARLAACLSAERR